MISTLPTLKILPLDRLILHEDHDMQRTLPLVEKLRAQGILRNPPIVMPLTDGSGRYMVLDGANRVTSLRELEFPHIVAQVVEASNPHVNLQTWNHIVWGMDADTLMSSLRKVKGIELVKIDHAKIFGCAQVRTHANPLARRKFIHSRRIAQRPGNTHRYPAPDCEHLQNARLARPHQPDADRFVQKDLS